DAQALALEEQRHHRRHRPVTHDRHLLELRHRRAIVQPTPPPGKTGPSSAFRAATARLGVRRPALCYGPPVSIDSRSNRTASETTFCATGDRFITRRRPRRPDPGLAP